MLMWSILWATIGLAVGLVFRFGTFGTFSVSTDFPGGIVPAAAAAGAITGAVIGFVFACLLMLAERNRGISEMRASRIGLWAAIAAAGTTYLFLPEPTLAAVAGVLGFGGGALALRLAARGEKPEVVQERKDL